MDQPIDQDLPTAAGTALAVLAADNHLLAVAKPAGQPIVPDASGDRSLLDAAREWVRVTYDKPGNVYLGVVHRLDRPVSGVVLFARTSKAAARLSEQFRTQSVQKRYLAVCPAAPFTARGAARAGSIAHWLRKDRSRNTVSVVAAGSAGAQEAETAWRVLELRGEQALLELLPRSGRAHQLRVACAALGAPIRGDLRYGAPVPLPDRSVALHAQSLRVEHPTRREPVTCTAEPPDRPWWRGWEAISASSPEQP